MMMFALTGLLGGLLIGGRLKVYATIPVLLAGAVIAVVAVAAGGTTPGHAAFACLCFNGALQVGYAAMIALGVLVPQVMPREPHLA